MEENLGSQCTLSCRYIATTEFSFLTDIHGLRYHHNSNSGP